MTALKIISTTRLLYFILLAVLRWDWAAVNAGRTLIKMMHASRHSQVFLFKVDK